MESYAHKAAKDVVISWLDAADNDRLDDIYTCCLGTAWLTPEYWAEYPITKNRQGFNPCWEGEIPTYESLLQSDSPAMVILDVAVAEYGRTAGVKTGIEIVHKNPPSQMKLGILQGLGLRELLVLPASWILGQIAPPRRIPEEFWVWR